MCVVVQIILPEDMTDTRGIYDVVCVHVCVCVPPTLHAIL